MIAGLWFVHVAQLLWQTAIVTIACVLIVRGSRRLSPHWRYAVTWVALVKYVVPPMLPLPSGIFGLAAPVSESRFAWTLGSIVRDSRFRGLIAALALVHLAGFVIAVVRLAMLRQRLRAIANRATPEDLAPGLDVRVSDEITVAMTFGIRRPVILIPAINLQSMAPAQLRAVIAHECRHIARRDAAALFVESLVAAIWWFDPFLRLLIRERRMLREQCCDDEVLAQSPASLVDYARAMSVAAAGVAHAAPRYAAAMASGTDIPSRLARIAEAGFAPQRRATAGQLVAAVLLALLLLPGLRVSADNVIAFDRATIRAFHH